MFERGVEQVRQMPIGALAAMLDALSGSEIAAAGEGATEAMVLATQRVINAMGAIQAQAIAALASCERAEHEAAVAETQAAGLTSSPGEALDEWEFLGDRIAPLLCMTGRGAQTRVDLAFELTRRLPRTLAAMRSGGLDTYRAGIIATQASLVRPHLVPELEECLFPDSPTDSDPAEADGPRVPDARDLHSTKLGARLRRLTATIDPASIGERCRRARRERFVAIGPGAEPGITHWTADLPVEGSLKAWAAVDALAHDYVRGSSQPDGTRRTLAQARADAMVDLLVGAATVTTTMHVTVPVEAIEAIPGQALEATVAALSALPGQRGPQSPRRQQVPRREQREPRPPSQQGEHSQSGRDRRRNLSLTQLAEQPGRRTAASTTAVPLGIEVPRHGVLPLAQAQQLAADADTRLTALYIDARTGRRLPQDAPPETRRGADADTRPDTTPDTARGGPPETTRGADADTTPDTARGGPPELTGSPDDSAASAAGRYRPSTALERAVRARDRTCRFPGCSMPSRRCDLDHVIRFPDGPTDEGNLHSLCRHHHRLKHHTRWRVSMDDEAVCTWTSPTGQVYRTTPFDHRQLLM